jgi:putative ABC transport system permease protein
MVPVARRNLLAEKGRLAISVAGVALAVLLIAIVLALYRGFSGTGQTIEDLPGDIWVVQRGTADPFHSVSLLTRAEVEALRGLDGAVAVTPVLARRMEFQVAGGDAGAFFMALDVPEGAPVAADVRDRFLPRPGEVSIDTAFSRMTGLGTGDRFLLNGQEFTVGRVRARATEAFAPFAFLAFGDAQRIFGLLDTVNYAILSLAPGADPAMVAAGVTALSPRLGTFSRGDFARAVRKEIDETFIPVIALLTAIGFVVGAAVVGLMIYTATIERGREYGVMKAVGASGAFLYRIVLGQSALLTGAGFLLGAAGAWGVAAVAARAVPEFATEFRWLDLLGVLAASAVMAVVASLVPVRRINRIDPAQVFRA